MAHEQFTHECANAAMHAVPCNPRASLSSEHSRFARCLSPCISALSKSLPHATESEVDRPVCGESDDDGPCETDRRECEEHYADESGENARRVHGQSAYRLGNRIPATCHPLHSPFKGSEFQRKFNQVYPMPDFLAQTKDGPFPTLRTFRNGKHSVVFFGVPFTVYVPMHSPSSVPFCPGTIRR